MYEKLIQQLQAILPGYAVSPTPLDMKGVPMLWIHVPGRSLQEAESKSLAMIVKLKEQFGESNAYIAIEKGNLAILIAPHQRMELTEEEEKHLKAELDSVLRQFSEVARCSAEEGTTAAAADSSVTATSTTQEKKMETQLVQASAGRLVDGVNSQREPLLSFQGSTVVKRRALNLYEEAVLKVLEMLQPYIGDVRAVEPIIGTPSQNQCLFRSTCIVIYDGNSSSGVDPFIKIAFADYDTNYSIISVIDMTLARCDVTSGIERSSNDTSLTIYPLRKGGFSQLMRVVDKWYGFLRDLNKTHIAGCLAAINMHRAVVANTALRDQILQAEDGGRLSASLAISASKRPGVISVNVMDSSFFANGSQLRQITLPNRAGTDVSVPQQQLVTKSSTASAKCCIQ